LYKKILSNKNKFNNIDPSLMILEGCNDKGICILLSGPDFEQLEKVKQSLKLIFIICKNLQLEKDILFLDKILYSNIFFLLNTQRNNSENDVMEEE